MHARLVSLLVAILSSSPALAQQSKPRMLDRVALRFEASELGGSSHPHFIFERELAFEARLEAMAEEERGFIGSSRAYEDRHLRAAVDRHVTEVILATLLRPDDYDASELRRRIIATQLVLEQRVGGRSKLLFAATSEGMEVEDLSVVIEREARASLYLDRVVAPMFEPSDAELREVFRSETTPFRGKNFDEIATPLRRWYAAERISSALAAFFHDARARIHGVWIPGS